MRSTSMISLDSASCRSSSRATSVMKRLSAVMANTLVSSSRVMKKRARCRSSLFSRTMVVVRGSRTSQMMLHVLVTSAVLRMSVVTNSAVRQSESIVIEMLERAASSLFTCTSSAASVSLTITIESASFSGMCSRSLRLVGDPTRCTILMLSRSAGLAPLAVTAAMRSSTGFSHSTCTSLPGMSIESHRSSMSAICAPMWLPGHPSTQTTCRPYTCWTGMAAPST
mmetsp:Transcript_31996/g.101889  ORF Transcript_31996/g.101889 Transcript_31996/m.101889 type:complete len:225 (+) Transcript_31996:377-1051(+)